MFRRVQVAPIPTCPSNPGHGCNPWCRYGMMHVPVGAATCGWAYELGSKFYPPGDVALELHQ